MQFERKFFLTIGTRRRQLSYPIEELSITFDVQLVLNRLKVQHLNECPNMPNLHEPVLGLTWEPSLQLIYCMSIISSGI